MAPADISRRTATIWLIAIFALGAALRLWHIGREALWADEALTAVITHYPAMSLWLDPIDPTGPFYYLVYAVLVPSGAAPVAARLPSLAAGLITILATYGLGRTLSGRFVGLVAAAIVALSSPLIEYSQEARQYAVLVAMVSGSAWSLASLYRPSSERARLVWAACFILTSCAASYTHLVGTLWAVSCIAGLLCAVRSGRAHLSGRQALLIALIGALLISPEIRRLALFATTNNNFTWLAPASLSDLGRLVTLQWVPFGHRAPMAVGFAAIALAGLTLWSGRERARDWLADRQWQLLVPLLLIGQAPLVWFVGEVVTPILMYRTILQAIPGFAVAAALLLSWQLPRLRGWYAAAFATLCLGSALNHGTAQPKAPWRAAAAAVDGAKAVLVCPAYQTPAFMAQSDAKTVLTRINRQVILVRSPSDGGNFGWDRAYFERVRNADLPSGGLSQPRPISEGSFAIVSIGCPSSELAAINLQLRSSSYRLVQRTTVKPAVRAWVNLDRDVDVIIVERWKLDSNSPPPPAPRS